MSMRVVTFGEIMGRLAPSGFQRFRQAFPGSVEFTFGGGEANVAVALAQLGADVSFVTALPTNPVADAAVGTLRGLEVDTSAIIRTPGGRLGLYYLETGANERAGTVIYDREGSVFASTAPEAYQWPTIFSGADWFHVTGITPAVSENAAHAALAAVQAAKAGGLTVSCDLNYRSMLWRWWSGSSPRALAQELMRGILPHVDVLLGNEEDAEMVLGVKAAGTDVATGRLDIGAYREVATEVVGQFPNLKGVAITLRASLSATHNRWGGIYYDGVSGDAFVAPRSTLGDYVPYDIHAIVDRVGTGDAFAAGLIYAFRSDGLRDPQTALNFAVAASCLKHSIPGDFNYATRDEIDALIKGSVSGRVQR